MISCRPLSSESEEVDVVQLMKSFLLMKTKTGMGIEVLNQLKQVPEISEIHVVTGKYDFLICLDTQETDLDPRRRVLELLVDRIDKLGGIFLVDTIIPVDSQASEHVPFEGPTCKAFVFIQSKPGKEKELMHKLLKIREVIRAHLLSGRPDLLAELEVEKSFIDPPPNHVADIVENKVEGLKEVLETATYVPIESIIR